MLLTHQCAAAPTSYPTRTSNDALIQRVTQAEVRVGERITGAIDRGILALIGVSQGDDDAAADRLLERVLTYRIFPDAEGA